MQILKWMMCKSLCWICRFKIKLTLLKGVHFHCQRYKKLQCWKITQLILRGLITPDVSRVASSPDLTGDCPGGCQGRSGRVCRGAGSSSSAPAPSPACVAPSWPRSRARPRCSCSAESSWRTRPRLGCFGLAARTRMVPVLPAWWTTWESSSVRLPQITILPLTVATYSPGVTLCERCSLCDVQRTTEPSVTTLAASAHCATPDTCPGPERWEIMGKHSSQVQINMNPWLLHQESVRSMFLVHPSQQENYNEALSVMRGYKE